MKRHTWLSSVMLTEHICASIGVQKPVDPSQHSYMITENVNNEESLHRDVYIP